MALFSYEKMIPKKKCTIFEKWKSLTAFNFAAPWGKWTSGTFLEASNLTLFGARRSWGWQDFKSSKPLAKNTQFIYCKWTKTPVFLQGTLHMWYHSKTKVTNCFKRSVNSGWVIRSICVIHSISIIGNSCIIRTLPTDNKHGQGSIWSKMGIFKWFLCYVKLLPRSYPPDMF